MIKKNLALLLVLVFLFSCGKKGDPVYKAEKYIYGFKEFREYLKS